MRIKLRIWSCHEFKNYLADMHFDIGQQIEVESAKIEATLQHAKKEKVFLQKWIVIPGPDRGTTQRQKQAVEI